MCLLCYFKGVSKICDLAFENRNEKTSNSCSILDMIPSALEVDKSRLWRKIPYCVTILLSSKYSSVLKLLFCKKVHFQIYIIISCEAMEENLRERFVCFQHDNMSFSDKCRQLCWCKTSTKSKYQTALETNGTPQMTIATMMVKKMDGLLELKQALQKFNDSAVGPDDIHYKLLTNLHTSTHCHPTPFRYQTPPTHLLRNPRKLWLKTCPCGLGE